MVLLHRKANSDLKNAGWAEKRRRFKEHKYTLTAQVAAVSEWDVTAISKRQVDLAKLALRAWPV
jgi:hypothetical protein